MAWQAARLQESLQARWPHARVRVVARTGSTNSDLLALLHGDQGVHSAQGTPGIPAAQPAQMADGAPAQRHLPAGLQVLLAEQQTAGRGRQGRTWSSSPGDSLTFSLSLPLRPRHGWGALSLVVGHAVAQVLQPWPADGLPDPQGCLMLKWPNDLWWYPNAPRDEAERAAGRKIGGILIETVALPGPLGASGTRACVIGLGLNLRPVATDPSAGPTACVRDIAQSASSDSVLHTDTDLWHALVHGILEAVSRFEQEGLRPFASAIERREVLVGQQVTMSAGPPHEGRCIGLDGDGALRVRLPDGLEHRVVAGEVRVRPLTPPTQAS